MIFEVVTLDPMKSVTVALEVVMFDPVRTAIVALEVVMFDPMKSVMVALEAVIRWVVSLSVTVRLLNVPVIPISSVLLSWPIVL